MRLSLEMPVRQEQDYEVPALSREENKTFWLAEQQFNLNCFRLIYSALFVANLLFNAMLFVVHFETNLYSYIFFQGLNIALNTSVVFTFLPSIYLVSLFGLNLMRFFAKRFRHLQKRIDRLSAATKQVNNPKLTKLIHEHHCVYHDLIEMNEFFRDFVGVNFICFCAMGVLNTFTVISEPVNWKFRIFAITLGMFITSIAIPFVFANSVSVAVILTLNGFL